MNYLEEFEFTPEEITEVEANTPEKILNELKESAELVKENITFLKNLGVTNFKDVVIKYSDMFLMDDTNFKNFFLKYDKDDLIDKIAKNISIIEHL